MPGADWIPIISQIKMYIQLRAGDEEGAAKTYENFCKECPIFSQATSVVQVFKGDFKGAWETQKCCINTLNNVANGIPGVGHLKGGIHHLCGDEKGKDEALKAANRSSIVIGSGAIAGLASGGLMAVAAGIAAGAAHDTVTSIANEKPEGVIAAVANAVENPKAGNIVDVVFSCAADGLTGYTGGEIANSFANGVNGNNVGDVNGGVGDAPNSAALASPKAKLIEMKHSINSPKTLQLGKKINSMTKEIKIKSQIPLQSLTDIKAPYKGNITQPVIISGCSESANVNRDDGNKKNKHKYKALPYAKFEEQTKARVLKSIKFMDYVHLQRRFDNVSESYFKFNTVNKFIDFSELSSSVHIGVLIKNNLDELEKEKTTQEKICDAKEEISAISESVDANAFDTNEKNENDNEAAHETPQIETKVLKFVKFMEYAHLQKRFDSFFGNHSSINKVDIFIDVPGLSESAYNDPLIEKNLDETQNEKVFPEEICVEKDDTSANSASEEANEENKKDYETLISATLQKEKKIVTSFMSVRMQNQFKYKASHHNTQPKLMILKKETKLKQLKISTLLFSLSIEEIFQILNPPVIDPYENK